MYVNDEHVVTYLHEHGVAPAAATNYVFSGCSNPVAEPQWHYFQPIHIGFVSRLRAPQRPVRGDRQTNRAETGDPRAFKSFEEVYQAFQRQHEFITARLLWAARLGLTSVATLWRSPLLSTLMGNCLQEGKDMAVGGNRHYPLWYVKDRAIVDTADSLMAIKKLVFDEKKLTMAELLDALDSNFEGARGEEIRRMCLNAPKYGNDIDDVDYLLRDVAKFSASVISSMKHSFGLPWTIERHGVAWHYSGGKGVGALPNGRKALEPLNDGSLSPMRGADTRGPTAVLNSAIKADYKEAANVILNQKLPLSFVQAPEALDKICSLTDTFLARGGVHIQYNFLDKEVLIEAKKHPEDIAISWCTLPVTARTS